MTWLMSLTMPTYLVLSALCIFSVVLVISFFAVNAKRKVALAQLAEKSDAYFTLSNQYTEMQTRYSLIDEQLQQLQHTHTRLQASNKELELNLQELTLAYQEEKITHQQAGEKYQAQLQFLEQSRETLKAEFAELAEQVLKQKGERLREQSEQSLSALLNPVSNELKGFRHKMEHIHSEDLKQRAQLQAELVQLQKLNVSITEQAERLSNALQGQKKTQGNWGELMLENVLDSAGLRLNQDYHREVVFKTNQGALRPDVVVNLPGERHLVIDAKTSLNAYTDYVNAKDDASATIALTQHAQAVEARIKELADKSYHTLPGLVSPDVVILFVPIESAYVAAIKHSPKLFQSALEQNILVATPTTLLTSLNIVKQLWRFEDQSKHTLELAKRAERFYAKLNGFLLSMDGVGKQLDKAKDTYDSAFKQLYSGRGNLIKQAAEFKELGVSVQKELDPELVEKANMELTYHSE